MGLVCFKQDFKGWTSLCPFINIRISQEANFLYKEYSSYKVRYTTVFFGSSSSFICTTHVNNHQFHHKKVRESFDLGFITGKCNLKPD